MGVHACLLGLFYIMGEGIGGQSDDGDRFCVRMVRPSDLLCRRQSVHHGHSQIHQDRVIITGFGAFHHFHSNKAVFGMFGFDPLEFKKVFHDFGIFRIIFHNQDPAAFK